MKNATVKHAHSPMCKIEANSQIGGNAKKQVTLLLLLNLIIVDCLHDDFCCDHITLPGVSDQKTTVA